MTEIESLLEPYLLGKLAVEQESALIDALYQDSTLYLKLEECEDGLMIQHLRGHLDLQAYPDLAKRWACFEKREQMAFLKGLDEVQRKFPINDNIPIPTRPGSRLAWGLAMAASLAAFGLGLLWFSEARTNREKLMLAQQRLAEQQKQIVELTAANRQLRENPANPTQTPPPNPLAAAGTTQGRRLPNRSSFGDLHTVGEGDTLFWFLSDYSRFGGQLRPELFEATLTTPTGQERVILSLDRDALSVHLPSNRLPALLTLRFMPPGRQPEVILDRLRLIDAINRPKRQ